MATEYKKFALKIIRQLFHLLPLCIIGLISFNGANQAQMQFQYDVRGPVSPKLAVQRKVRVYTLNDDSLTRSNLVYLNEIRPEVVCINLSKKFKTPRCIEADLDQKPDEKSFVNLVHSAFFREEHKDENEVENLYYYGKLNVFNPYPLSSMVRSEFEALPEDHMIVLIDDWQNQTERWESPFGFLSTPELALTVVFNHLQGDSYKIQSRWSTFLLTFFVIVAVGLLTYSYPLTLAIVLSITLYGFLIVTSIVLFERYGYQLSLFGPALSIFLAYIVSISDQLNQKRRLEYVIHRDQEDHKQLETMRQNFLSLVSHDLKTPVAKIKALMEKLLSETSAVTDPKQKQIFESVVSANDHLQKTISTLLLLNRIESNQVKIHQVPSDLKAVLERSIQGLKAQAQESNIEIIPELEPLFLANFDSDLIREVADNLISNAIKYSSRNSVITIRCGDEDNALALSPPQSAIWFEVQDQGPGIPKQDRHRVLQKFQRGSKEATSKGQSVKGTGLGLYLAKYFVEEHHGKLELISKTHDESLNAQTALYFSEGASGTVVRVVIPTESS